MNKSPEEIIHLLKNKFDSNYNHWRIIEDKKFGKIIISVYTLSSIADLLDKEDKSVHHNICLKVFNELIADIASSIYLSACAMDKPAHVLIRRILELGVASVYLWDMPHICYNWQNHDQDLSFSEMVKHLNSEGYIDFVIHQNNYNYKPTIINQKACQKIYGKLSDVVHGKITSFESELPNRFQFDEADWFNCVSILEEVVSIVIEANVSRHNLKSKVLGVYPSSFEVIK